MRVLWARQEQRCTPNLERVKEGLQLLPAQHLWAVRCKVPVSLHHDTSSAQTLVNSGTYSTNAIDSDGSDQTCLLF